MGSMGNLTPDTNGDCSYKQSATTMKTAINEEHKPKKTTNDKPSENAAH